MGLLDVRDHSRANERRSSRRVLTLFLALVVVCVTMLSTAQPSHAAALHTFGDMHNCEALGQGATVSISNLTSEPFDAAQIPYSPTFSFTTNTGASDYLVACQQKVINANPPAPYNVNAYQPNYNNAGWDGYGNPFQCVELIDRYDQLRWHDNWIWGNAGPDWNVGQHPGHFAQEQNGGTTAPESGDILIWNNTTDGHIAVIIAVNAGYHTVTVLEQNFNYATYSGKYVWYTAERTLSYTFNRFGTSQYHFVIGAAYTAYTQTGGSFTGTDAASPVGWLHG